MKKNILLMLVLIIGTGQIIAQKANRGDRAAAQDRIKAVKIAVFTETLDLTSKEAEKFWPIYNEYEKKIRSIDKQVRELGKGFESKTDKEIEAAIEKRFSLQEEKIEIEREYYKKFKKAIPVKKIAKIPVAQRAFKKRLVQEMRNRENMRRRNGGGEK